MLKNVCKFLSKTEFKGHLKVSTFFGGGKVVRVSIALKLLSEHPHSREVKNS